MAKNTIMHPHMWGSILKSMTKSNFISLELKFVCHPFVSDHALRKQVFRNLYIFQSIEGERKSVPEQVIQQPHIYFIVSNNSYYAMMEDIFYCLYINSIGGSGFIIRAAHCLQPWGRSSTVAGYTC